MNVTLVTELTRKLFEDWSHDQYDAAAGTVPAGSDGLLLFPYLAGEHTPNLPRGSGLLHGITVKNLTPAPARNPAPQETKGSRGGEDGEEVRGGPSTIDGRPPSPLEWPGKRRPGRGACRPLRWVPKGFRWRRAGCVGREQVSRPLPPTCRRLRSRWSCPGRCRWRSRSWHRRAGSCRCAGRPCRGR